MKIPQYPGTRTPQTQKADSYHAAVGGSVQTKPVADAIDFREKTTTAHRAHPLHQDFMVAVTDKDSEEKIRSARNDLIVDLMQEVLPSWIRQRWMTMLMEMDFTTEITDQKIERLCRECSAARGNLGRLMPQASPEESRNADTELLLLTNGFNELANSWWLHKGKVLTH